MSTTRLDHRLGLEAPAVHGHSFLAASALVLMLSGLVALYLGATGRLLPHDERFLGMSARDLCAVHGCRIVHFMIHDRVSFGGALVAVGALYLWLAESPLRRGQAWAWWVVLFSGAVGFGSFFAYLGSSGYLDSWHAAATLALFPCFLLRPDPDPRCSSTARRSPSRALSRRSLALAFDGGGGPRLPSGGRRRPRARGPHDPCSGHDVRVRTTGPVLPLAWASRNSMP